MKHVLITGGAGFIGSHLAECLIARECRVTVLDDESTGTVDNLAALRDHFHFHYVQGSAADKRLVRSLVSDVDEVYHLAAAVGAHLIATAPVHTIETNIYTTELLLSELFRRSRQGHTAKLFLASSAEVHGKAAADLLREDDDLVFGPIDHPRWSYGVSRAATEHLAMAYWRQHRLPVVIGRLFNVAGPRQTPRFGAVLPRMVEAALAGGPIIVYGDGSQRRAFVHVADAVQAMIDLMEFDDAVAKVFNIGVDQSVTISELARKVAEAVPGDVEVEFQSYSEAYGPEAEDIHTVIPDLSRLRATIGYRPAHDLATIIRDTVEDARIRARRKK